jgi:hypothetical protein
MEGAKMIKNKSDIATNSSQANYFAIHVAQIITGLIFLSIGIISAIYYDYGLLVFLFAIPQFFGTGLVPTLIALIFLSRAFIEAEKVFVSSNSEKISIRTFWIKKKKIEVKKADVRYIGLKYCETKTKRWIIVFLLVLFTIVIFYQNTIDLWGFARIIPMLLAGTILMVFGILIFVAFPRRFIEIGTIGAIILVPYRNQSRGKTLRLFEILGVSFEPIEEQSGVQIVLSNIKSQLIEFIIGVFLLTIGIIFTITPLFYGEFTELVSITLGLKILVRVIGGEFLYEITSQENLYLGRTLRFTFIHTKESEIEHHINNSPLRFHPIEIICMFYLVSQAVKYSFRFIWWNYTGFNIIYISIGIAIITLFLVRWIYPHQIVSISFEEFSIKFKEYIPYERAGFRNLKSITNDENFRISLILFAAFLIIPIIYFIVGGNFLLL